MGCPPSVPCSIRAEQDRTSRQYAPLREQPEWRVKDSGPFSADDKAVLDRARYVRKWLRDRPEQCIVLVAHGTFIQWLLFNRHIGNEVEFANCEVRRYRFAIGSAIDDGAELIHVDGAGEAAVGDKTASSPEM